MIRTSDHRLAPIAAPARLDHFRGRVRTSGRFPGSIAIGIVLAAATVAFGQDDFWVTLRDGTVLRTPLSVETIPWRRVDASGTISSDQLRLDSVTTIELARTPASRQLIEIRQQLANLQSENYHVRNQAEANLIQNGSQFIDVLTAARESGNAEVRYRIGRVLRRLQSKDAKRVDADFDVVTLADGTIISGDLEFDSLRLEFRGREFQLGRDTILQIARTPGSETKGNPSDWTNAAWSKPGDRFYQAGDVHVTFDSGRLNESFAKFEDVHDAYVFRGVRLKADCGADPANVVTAGFAVDQGRSRKNSAATMMTRNSKKYLGAIQIDFCEPGLPDIPAAAHRVACYIALVDHPRDFVMDAYSADGQIVASSEALEKTSFIGVESAIPIAYVRVQPNRNLKIDPAEQDANFVIDDLNCDDPQPSADRGVPDQIRLVLNDGSRLLCSSVQFEGPSLSARGGSAWGWDQTSKPFSFSVDEVQSVTFPTGPALPREVALWGYFSDGSQLPLDIQGEDWIVRGSPQWKVAQSDLAGVFGGEHVLRFPLAIDLETQKVVAIKPAERWLVPEVKIDSGGVSWNQESAELREPISLENSSHSADTTSQFELAQAPSIWWRPPLSADPVAGWLKTRDGRVFALNGATGVQIENIDVDSVALRRADETISIAWNDVSAVKFPSR